MKILVTGGTGVIGESLVRELHRRGHSIRVLSRHAGRGEVWWPEGVEGWAGDVAQQKTIVKAAEGCGAVIHIAGIVEESPPNRTFQSVNIDGTRWMVAEAERAGAQKFIYISSLGAERGSSAYHKSKCVAEEVVKQFTRDWVIVRPGAVYGPGDEHLSVLLRMVRSLPVIPTIGDGNQQFQPIWHRDLALILAACLERDDMRCTVLDAGGPDLTSQNDLVKRMRKLTDRPAVQAPLPEIIAGWGIKALGAIGVDVPFTEAQLKMLTDGNVVPAGRENALDILGIPGTTLDEGLSRLVDDQPAQLPVEGVGTLERKRFWVDIDEARFDADALFEHVRDNFADLMPSIVEMSAEPGTRTRIEEGATLTLDLPLRGHVQVRVGEAGDRRITFLTLAGHPIAGAVRFDVLDAGDRMSDAGRGTARLRFQIEVYERPANVVDEFMLRTVGEWLQRAAWVGLAENVAKAAGGRSRPVETTREELDDRELEVVNEWVKTLSAQVSRNSRSSGLD